MRLVIDANILFSALIKDSKTRQIIKQKDIGLVAPKELIQEFNAHKKEIIKKSGISGKQFFKISKALLDLIKVEEKNSYMPFLENAVSICQSKEKKVFLPKTGLCHYIVQFLDCFFEFYVI